ncbi:MAG: aldo/keto reductase [Candidatus Tectomicrobia bacterium]|nr:aldo/keto reductase [Candidatus Tectomicrobia bacterium]
MEYRTFGKTGLQVSAIGFGCWEMGGTYGYFDEGEITRAIHKALDLGINCFDTAEAYGRGQSETLLAKALGNRRKDIILVTKFGIGYEGKRDSSRARAMRAIEESLSRLNTDHVDVYLVHWPDVNTAFEETMRALDEIVRQGKARFVGVSNFTIAQMQECMRARDFEVYQVGYHLFDRRMEKEIFPFCAEQNIGVMGYGSLAHGLLTGAFTEETSFEESDWRSRGGLFGLRLFEGEKFKQNVRAVNELKAIAARRGKKVAQLALAWGLSNPTLSMALVGARKPEEVEENMGALGWNLTETDKQEVNSIFEKYQIDTAPNVWLE